VKHVDYRLLSMHKSFKGNTRVWCDVSHHKNSAMREVMLDSGAFTAFTKGHKVLLDDLIRTYDDVIRKLNPKLQVWLINLDVIPGAMDRVATPQEFVEAIEKSEANYKILKKRYGDRVIPVYHRTEGESQLLAVARMNDYVGVGFGPKTSEEYRVAHAEEVLAILKPMGKTVHGLATTGYEMLKRVPFDTVDSATWLYIAAMGGVMFVDDRNEIRNLAISSSSPKQSELRQHYNSLSHEEQRLIGERLSAAGCTIEQVQTDLSYRILFNAHQLREWLKSYRTPKITHDGSLFPL
jgi:hypothetical protein